MRRVRGNPWGDIGTLPIVVLAVFGRGQQVRDLSQQLMLIFLLRKLETIGIKVLCIVLQN